MESIKVNRAGREGGWSAWQRGPCDRMVQWSLAESLAATECRVLLLPTVAEPGQRHQYPVWKVAGLCFKRTHDPTIT